MDALRWLEELRHELTRRKLPRRYVKRLVVELSDHITDFMEDSMSTDALESQTIVDRMGMPSQVAQRAAIEYQHQRFPARHPWMVFAALPVALLPLLWFGFALTAIAVVSAVDSLFTFEAPFPLWGKLVVALILYTIIEGPIVLSAALTCRWAKRSGLGRKWPMLGCLLLALISIQVCPVLRTHNADGVWSLAFVTPYVDLGHGQFYTSAGTELLTGMARATQVFQFALPLLIGAWALRRPVGPMLFGRGRLSTG